MFQSEINKRIALMKSSFPLALAAVALLAVSAFGAETARPVRREYDVLRSFPPGPLAVLCSGDKPDAKGLTGGNRGNGSWLEAGPQRGSCRAVIAAVVAGDLAAANDAWRGIDVAFAHQRAGDVVEHVGRVLRLRDEEAVALRVGVGAEAEQDWANGLKSRWPDFTLITEPGSTSIFPWPTHSRFPVVRSSNFSQEHVERLSRPNCDQSSEQIRAVTVNEVLARMLQGRNARQRVRRLLNRHRWREHVARPQ